MVVERERREAVWPLARVYVYGWWYHFVIVKGCRCIAQRSLVLLAHEVVSGSPLEEHQMRWEVVDNPINKQGQDGRYDSIYRTVISIAYFIQLV